MDLSKIRGLLFIIFFGVTTIGFIYLLRPFFYPIFWAAVLASLFYPVYRKINNKIKHNNTSSLLTIGLILVIIIIPVTLLSGLIFKQSFNLYGSLANKQGPVVSTVKNVISWIKNNPITDKLNIDEQQVTAKLTEVAKTITDLIFTAAKDLTQNSLTFLVMFIIMIYTLFFFLKDGENLLKRLSHISPLGNKHELIMYKKFTSTARAALKGTLIVGGIQGFLGALLFYITGIEGALIWGIIMMLFSVVPGFGSYIVWLPAAIIMFIVGNTWQGIVIVAVGAFLISTIDNFIRPILIGKDTQMHPLLILFSTLGGILFFGISGFIIGPIITAFLMSLWGMYEQYYQDELAKD